MNNSTILKSLNEKQIEAVTCVDGPLLVIAGAGSGKTRALTNRIAYLIQEKGVSPWNVLAVTFTNKAANEMKERVAKLLGKSARGGPLFKGNFSDMVSDELPTIGTFHSVCVRILRKHLPLLDYEGTFAIYDMADQQILMKQLMEQAGISPKSMNPKAILGAISNAKNQLIGPDGFQRFANTAFMEKVAMLYPHYQKALKQNNALDFDDLIMKTVELFRGFPEVLEEYQEKFRYISVDEYQDTNHAQYILIKLLAAKYRNLCVIGDEDQSIYSWRGATIKNIVDFEKDYPEAKIVLLEQNYRSTQIILDAAHSVIAKNKGRKEKKLWTEADGGKNVSHWLAKNERHEGELIATEIGEILKQYESPDYNDFVVLYRTNAQSRVLEEVFLRHGLPYRIVGGIKFYDRKEIKDMLAYLRVLHNPADGVSLLRIINVPSRKIGSKTIEVVQNYARSEGLTLLAAMARASSISGLSEAKVKVISKFVKLIDKLSDVNSEFAAAGVIKHVLEDARYKEFLDDGTSEGEARLENVRELISVASKYDSLEAGLSLSVFLEEVSLIADIDTSADGDNAVTFMTIHSAKGLEFPNVFVAGLEEGIFPHNRSLLEREQLEEERRLMYVAMTRAMERLYLLHAMERMLYGEYRRNAPSQFLNDIPEELVDDNFGGHNSGVGKVFNRVRGDFSMEGIGDVPVPVEHGFADAGDSFEDQSPGEISYKVGEKVSHNVFGVGFVVEVQGGVITVAFDDPKVGVKKLAASVAPLKKV
ncbi:UvrD-helicase domain-containing protein [Candidatus Peregrinibacteria bacterium]|jgi:DNA helicase II / ATP-dependent DNA helicase PcrA|nr:UvrD-helicase domain-containing protein [Candidatus Peregrinibacteria bacterium]MBT4147701.1 UvrD-helicase domain-containing protein [Candidatus Peregrinibacteria bacterium]MBT4455754.1 UvrD-helicase domain-containing protein [Candidatus Peregrinibacteria bacterium]